MNRVMTVGSWVGAVLFLGVLLVTIVLPETIKAFARDYLDRRIEPGVTRSVQALEREVLPKLADRPELAAATTTEIARYRADPLAYIGGITSGGPAAPHEGPAALAGSLQELVTRRVTSIREVVKDHFREVFERLILDLRIFSVTNIVAFILVAELMRRHDARSPRLLVQAFIPFVATCYALTVYIRQDWFFNLLLDLHMGLGYPILIALTAFDLWRRWRRRQLRQGSSALVEDMIAG